MSTTVWSSKFALIVPFTLISEVILLRLYNVEDISLLAARGSTCLLLDNATKFTYCTKTIGTSMVINTDQTLIGRLYMHCSNHVNLHISSLSKPRHKAKEHIYKLFIYFYFYFYFYIYTEFGQLASLKLNNGTTIPSSRDTKLCHFCS